MLKPGGYLLNHFAANKKLLDRNRQEKFDREMNLPYIKKDKSFDPSTLIKKLSNNV